MSSPMMNRMLGFPPLAGGATWGFCAGTWLSAVSGPGGLGLGLWLWLWLWLGDGTCSSAVLFSPRSRHADSQGESTMARPANTTTLALLRITRHLLVGGL